MWEGDAATGEPLRAVRLWAFSHRYFIVLTTKGELYKVTTHKPYRLTQLKQPFDLGWTPTELATLAAEKDTLRRQQELQLLQRQRKEYFETFRKTISLLQLDSTTTDSADYVSAFASMAKKLGVSPLEALGRIKEDIEHDKALEEYMKSEEFRQFDEYSDACLKEAENIDLLRTALSEIANRLGVTLEETIKRMAKGFEQT